MLGNTTFSNALTMSVNMNFIWICVSRQLFGAAIAFQIFLMTLPSVEHIKWTHPIYLINKVLSSAFWVPTANLSYSIYLFHIQPAMLVGNLKFAVPDPSITDECQFDSNFDLFIRYTYVFILTVLMAMVTAFLVYFLVERPFIEGRKVFKNKHEVAKMENQV